MIIDRSQLLSDLYGFSLEDSGIIMGKPGIGKSYLIKLLKAKLIANKSLCFVIRIDNAVDFSDESINTELGINGNWIDIFNKIKIQEQKAVLIFDAFDAARDEKIRKGFLSQIRRAKRELSSKWNIIVSVRTYDAQKSPELLQLFPDQRFGSEYVHTKKIEIKELTDDEVGQVVNKNQKFSDFYQNASAELKLILHTPFFLEILDRIINDTTDEEIAEIKQFRSESQLLKVYWDKKISNTPDSIVKEYFLSTLTNLLVNKRTLNYNKLEFISALAGDYSKTFDYLRSENIIDEIALNQTRIAYAHNILFDYAVSVFCIQDQFDKFIAFIEGDLTRPFFLRPSFIYFFTALWYNERPTFWDFYFKLLDYTQKEIQLFVRLVLNGIICSEYATIEDLNNILSNSKLGANKPIVIRNFLQSIRFMRLKSTTADVALLVYLSGDLNAEFIFDVAFLLDRSISESGLNEIEFNLAGGAARNLLRYILNERALGTAKAYLDRIGAFRGIELVAKTYGTDVKESGNLFREVMEILKEPGFDINYFTNLAESVKHILKYDPVMVADIYNSIFGYNETSTEQTQMGPSVVMNLVSNRKQDFEMCYYRLQKFFPEFLEASPELAIKTGLTVVNQFINEDRSNSEPESIIKVPVNGKELKFQADYSSIWGDNTFGKPAEMAEAIVRYFDELVAVGDNTKLDKLIGIYFDNAISAFTWKLILKFFLRYPSVKPDEVFQYVSNAFLMKHTDTSFEIRELIDKFSPSFQDEQLDQLETLIFTIYDEGRTNTIAKALSRLPKDRLQQERSKKFMEMNDPVQNDPPFQHHSYSSPYTTDMWLKDQGVDLGNSLFKEIADYSNSLQRFNNQWLNETPTASDYNEPLNLCRLFVAKLNETHSGLPKELYQTALSEIAKLAAIVSRNFRNLSQEDYRFLEEVIAQTFAFKTSQDVTVDTNGSHHFTWSPTPRNSAAEALINLYCFEQSEGNLTLLKEGVNDVNHIIRFNTIRNLQFIYSANYEVYKEIITERLNKENSGFIYSVLMGSIIFKKELVAQEAPEVFKILKEKAKLFGEQESFVNTYTELLLYYLHDFHLDIAYQILFDAYPMDKLCSTIIFRLFERMHPSLPENDFINKANDHDAELKIIRNYILQSKLSLSKIDGVSLDMQNPEVKHALLVLDKIIQRIYFVLQPKSFGRNRTFELPIGEDNKTAFYFAVKPILEDIINVSATITENGLIIGHTAHYFIQTLNGALSIDPRDILAMVAQITRYSMQGGYTFDSLAVQEVVNLTEKLFADHRDLLLETDSFNNVLALLDIYINSGWINALELLWKLDEIFR